MSSERETKGPLEALFQEFVRRGAALGLNSFFLTEEAVRRAFSDKVPPEWSEYVSRQGEDTVDEVMERLTAEFGKWLRELDPAALLGEVLEDREITVRVELSAPKKKREPLKVVPED